MMKLAAMLVVCIVFAGANGAYAANSPAKMAKAFREWCSAPVPDFDAVDAKASSENLSLVQHRKMPIPSENDAFIEDKLWAIDDKCGTYALDLIQSLHKGKHMASCSVYFADITEDGLPDYLGKKLRLGQPRKATVSDDGKQLTFWNTSQPDVQIMLTSGSKGALKGATINIMQTLEPN